MLHFDRSGELKRRFLLTAVERNKAAQLRLRALQEIAASREAEAFDLSIDVIGMWTREEGREAAKVMLQALAEKRIGRRDQANAWIWRLAEYTREVHEEYAVQRWPETKRLLGLLVNSSGGAHARNARRLVHASRKHDRRLSAALLAAAVAHTPEAEEVLRGARTRMARKPSALSRELLRNFPKGRRGRNRRRRRKGDAPALPVGVQEGQAPEVLDGEELEAGAPELETVEPTETGTLDAAAAVAAAASAQAASEPAPKRRRSRAKAATAEPEEGAAEPAEDEPKPRRSRTRTKAAAEREASGDVEVKPKARRARSKAPVAEGSTDGDATATADAETKPKARRSRAKAPVADASSNGDAQVAAETEAKPKPRRSRAKAKTEETAEPAKALPDGPGQAAA
jgi:ribonuclease E